MDRPNRDLMSIWLNQIRKPARTTPTERRSDAVPGPSDIRHTTPERTEPNAIRQLQALGYESPQANRLTGPRATFVSEPASGRSRDRHEQRRSFRRCGLSLGPGIAHQWKPTPLKCTSTQLAAPQRRLARAGEPQDLDPSRQARRRLSAWRRRTRAARRLPPRRLGVRWLARSARRVRGSPPPDG